VTFLSFLCELSDSLIVVTRMCHHSLLLDCHCFTRAQQSDAHQYIDLKKAEEANKRRKELGSDAAHAAATLRLSTAQAVSNQFSAAGAIAINSAFNKRLKSYHMELETNPEKF